MNIKQSQIEVLEESRQDRLQEIDEDDLVQEKGTVIEISVNEKEEEYAQEQVSNNYPSLNSKSIKQSSEDLWEMSRNSSDDIDNVRVTGVKRSSFNLEESNLTESFSDLNQSVKEEQLKSKLQSKLKSIRQDNRVSPTSQEMKFYNMSIFTDRRVEEESPKKKKLAQSQEEKTESPINYQQSFYLTKKEPISQPKSSQKSSQEQKKIRVTFTSKNYFLQINEYSVQIDKKSLEDLYSQLFKKELFVPLFNYERFEDWAKIKDFSKYSLECQTHMNFKIYLERYVRYLNQMDTKILEEVIKNVQFIQQGKNQKRMVEQSSLNFFNLNNLIQQFKALIHSSKTQSLRKTLLMKIRSLTSLLKEGQKWSIAQKQIGVINKVKDTLWRDLSQVELLLSFESTEEFCCKKIENSPQVKFKEIYIRYRDSIRKEKSKVMTQIDVVSL